MNHPYINLGHPIDEKAPVCLFNKTVTHTYLECFELGISHLTYRFMKQGTYLKKKKKMLKKRERKEFGS